MIRVAIVGSGPAGIYAAESLVAHASELPDDVGGAPDGGPPGLLVDVLDRVPCPYGLVRYGVAPDHEKIRSISAALARVFDSPQVRFLGNVELGRDLDLADLHRLYDAVIVSCGASSGRTLGLPGDDLPGSFTATEFVSWYCGHPDTRVDAFSRTASSVAVVGMGNVAVDVARILLKPADELARTDVPQHVLDVLRTSTVEEVHLIGRRGPAEAKWTTRELKELGQTTGIDVVCDPAGLEVDASGEARLAAEPGLRRSLEVLREWAARAPGGHARKLHVHFLRRPVALLGDDSVQGVRVEAMRLDGSGSVRGTGEFEVIPAGMVVASVGYRGVPVPGMPFDQASGTIPHLAGRVLGPDGPVPGDYVAGWIKRGPTGVVGTNKHDAHETVASLLEDIAAGRVPGCGTGDPDAVLDLLAARGVQVVAWNGWKAIEQAEVDQGAALGRGRTKIVSREELLAASLGLDIPDPSLTDRDGPVSDALGSAVPAWR